MRRPESNRSVDLGVARLALGIHVKERLLSSNRSIKPTMTDTSKSVLDTERVLQDLQDAGLDDEDRIYTIETAWDRIDD